jgi:hypothetical protein
MLSTGNVGKRGKPLFGKHFFDVGLPGIAMRRFSACRGTPEKIHLRPASHLVNSGKLRSEGAFCASF